MAPLPGKRPEPAAKENLPVAELAKSFGGQPKVLATSATVGMNSSAARLKRSQDGSLAGIMVVKCIDREGS
jgi:hypothetical protein